MRLWYLLAHRLWVRSFLFCSLVSLPLRLPPAPSLLGPARSARLSPPRSRARWLQPGHYALPLSICRPEVHRCSLWPPPPCTWPPGLTPPSVLPPMLLRSAGLGPSQQDGSLSLQAWLHPL